MAQFNLDPAHKEVSTTSIVENRALFEKAQTKHAIRFFGTLNYAAIIGIVIATTFYLISAIIVFIHWGVHQDYRWLSQNEVSLFVNFFLTITGFLTGGYFNYLVDSLNRRN